MLQDERIRANAICNLPLLLARIGYEHVTELDAKIWYDFLFFFCFFLDHLASTNLYKSDLLANEKSELVLEAVARFGGFIICLSDKDNPIWKIHQNVVPNMENQKDAPYFRSDLFSIEPIGFEVLDKTHLQNTPHWFPVSILTKYHHMRHHK